MWKLIVLMTVVAAAWARSSRSVNSELDELWEHVHQLDHGHINVVVHGHGSGPAGHHAGHHESHEDHGHDDHHSTEDHSSHEDHGHEAHHADHHADHTDEHGEDTHIHVVMGPAGLDLYHGNPIPGADQIPVEFVHAVCHMEGGSQAISGTVHMRQRFMGKSPVTVDFDLSGFDHSSGHMHTFTINRFGNTNDQCSHVGHVFTPPHRHGAGQHGHHHEDHAEHHESHEDHEDLHHDAEHADHDGHRTEGVLGTLHCDHNGALHQQGLEFDSFTLMGFHSVYGRSLVVNGDDGILACCMIAKSNGDYFGNSDFPYTEIGREDHGRQGHGHGHHH